MNTKKKILIVDDDPKNIFALRLTLKAKGFDCLWANGASEGISLAQNNPSGIGIVLMDMMMPDMDGYEAIAVLRNDLLTAEIPVIAVTAQAMEGDREKCLDAGATDYLSKPIHVDHMLTVINKYFKVL